MNSEKDNQRFWDGRAKGRNIYKGQEFYTITPLPYYFKRRKVMLEFAEQVVMDANSIMDFGCGDGWYLNYFNKKAKKEQKFKGLDISAEMVKKAKKLNKNIDIYVSKDGIKKNEKYDLVYSFATLAHIEDTLISDIFKNISSALKKKVSL